MDPHQTQIHAAHSIREASPAWPVVRTVEEEVPNAFESTTDERTMQERTRLRVRHQKRTDARLLAKMRAFVEKFMASKGEKGMIAARRVDEDEAPVLKPRKGMRYQFTA